MYGSLNRITKGKTLPLTYVNVKGENAIVSCGKTEDGVKYYEVKTAQKNGWIAINTYYENGTFEETFEKGMAK